MTYIVSEQERGEFKRLENDKDRQTLIEKFWLRCDPTPGTAENEFKIEHYRCIRWANDVLLQGDLPGWQTERGRMYIVDGPPDEIEAHPKVPFQIWFYKNSGHRYYFDGEDYKLDPAKSSPNAKSRRLIPTDWKRAPRYWPHLTYSG